MGRLQAKTFLEAIPTNVLMMQWVAPPWLTDLPTQLLAKFEHADAARGKNLRGKRPLDFMHRQISRLKPFASRYILLPTKVPNSTIQIPGYWDFGLAFDFHSHARFTTYFKINMEKTGITGTGCGCNPGHLGMAHGLGFH